MLLRAQKETLVQKLTEELRNSRVSLLFSYTRLTSQGNRQLRDQSWQEHGRIRMISNNLLRLILKAQNREIDLPEKPLALAYGFADEVSAAKILVNFAKETETLKIIGGWVDNTFLETGELKTLASLPSREILQSELVGSLAGLFQGLVYSLEYPIQQLALVIKAIEEKKGENQ